MRRFLRQLLHGFTHATSTTPSRIADPIESMCRKCRKESLTVRCTVCDAVVFQLHTAEHPGLPSCPRRWPTWPSERTR
jgi:hypothetical protein